MTPFETQVVEALQKISERLKTLNENIERYHWYGDEILKKIDPKWKALSQDEVKPFTEKEKQKIEEEHFEAGP